MKDLILGYLKSKTFWLGVASIVTGVSGYFSNLPTGTSISTIIIGVLVIIVRTFTGTPLPGTPAAARLASADIYTYTPPTPEELAKMNWISRAYYWFWHDLCHAKQPFTYSLRQSARDFPLYWLLTPPLLIVALAITFFFTTAYAWHLSTAKQRTIAFWVAVPACLAIIAWLLVMHLAGWW
jgi:hypothetical protein